MFDIKNVKTRRLVIVGVVSLVLIVSMIIAVYFIFIKTDTHVRKPEVYLQKLKNDIYIKPGQFSSMKSDYPNITLATTQQIEQALKDGLKMCGHGMAVDNNNKEFAVYVKAGPGSILEPPGITGQYCASQGLDLNSPQTANKIWVYGVKPSNGTVGVYRFSAEKWSQYDALPTGR